jgi:hypothetical protein
MNSLEKIAATIKMQHVECVPVIAQVFGHAATLTGISINQYVRNGEILARCQLNAQRNCYNPVLIWVFHWEDWQLYFLTPQLLAAGTLKKC